MIKSILNDILELIRNEQDINKIKQICTTKIKNSKIKVRDKNSMIEIINNKKDYFSLVKCIYDLILKYEGDGVITKSLRGYRLRR